MYNRDDLNLMDVRNLRVACRNLGLKVSTKYTKDELVNIILEYDKIYSPVNDVNIKDVNKSVRVKRIKEQNNGLE